MPRPSRSDLALVALTLGIKVGLLAIGAVAVLMMTGELGELRNLLNPWNRWDAPHYTDIAIFGYMASDPGNLIGPDGYRQVYPGELDLYIVFYPLFPWLTTGVSWLVGDPVVAAFAVSSVASLFVAPLAARVVGAELGRATGFWAAIFLLIFPTAYFLHIGYTESLFLALVLATFWFVRTDRWWLAGGTAALATLTRVNGLVLLAVLAIEAFAAYRSDPEHRWRWRWLAGAGPLIGFGAYLLLNQVVYGDPMAWSEIQRDHWFKSLSPPWVGLAGAFRWTRDSSLDNAVMLGWMELGFVALGVAGTIVSAFRFRPSWTAWMGGNVLLFVSTGFVLSTPRYSLVLFPLMACFALLARRAWLGVALAALSGGLMTWFAWRFATGAWAF